MSPAGDDDNEKGGSAMSEAKQDKEIDIHSIKFQEALARLNECLTEDNLAAVKRIQEKTLTEDQIVVGIGIHLIKKLSGNAITNKKKSEMKCPCGCSAKLELGDKLYIGSSETWHGELDLFALGVGVTATRDVEQAGGVGDAGNSGREDSQGERTNLELKKDVYDQMTAGLQHVISQSIVFAWTEYNRHMDFSPFIPSLFIDKNEFLAVVYNPVGDSLIVALDSVKFIDDAHEDEHLRYSGIFVLWIVLHHRLFFQKEMKIANIKCGFGTQMGKTILKHYETLTEFQANVRHTMKSIQFSHKTCVSAEPFLHTVQAQRAGNTQKRKRSVSE